MTGQLKVTVTGGAGYLGSCLVPMLLERGHRVTVLDNFLYGVEPILHFATHPNVTIINGDVRRDSDLAEAVRGADAVIPLAAIVGFPACAADEAAALSTNLEATRKLLGIMDKGQVMLFPSTGSCYGRAEAFCTEETPINPLTVYARTKAESETAIFESPHAENAVCLRFATVFGAAARLRLDLLINDFVYKAVRDKIIVLYEGHFKRTFLHIRDAARSFVLMLESIDRSRGRVFNVGDDRLNYTKLQVAEAIRKQIAYEIYEVPIGTDLDARNYHVDYRRVQELGFKATIDLDQGIAEMIKICSFVKVRQPFRNA